MQLSKKSSAAERLIIVLDRFKLLEEVWRSSNTRKLVAFVEGIYNRKSIRSDDCKVRKGSHFSIPWSEQLQLVIIHFFLIDGMLTVDIGSSRYDIINDRKFSKEHGTDVKLEVFPKEGSHRIGKIQCSVNVQQVYEETITEGVEDGDDHFRLAIPDFRFKRLSRAVNWERIRSFNMDRVLQNNDVLSLLTCVDDIATGDVSQEDIDPKMFKAMQVAQYTSQYLLNCHNLMKGKEKLIQKAVSTFDDEEELLDLKIAKLKARQKALKRESKDLDKLTAEYTSSLREMNPKLLDRLYRTYRDRAAGVPFSPPFDVTELDSDEEGVNDQRVKKSEKKKKNHTLLSVGRQSSEKVENIFPEETEESEEESSLRGNRKSSRSKHDKSKGWKKASPVKRNESESDDDDDHSYRNQRYHEDKKTKDKRRKFESRDKKKSRSNDSNHYHGSRLHHDESSSHHSHSRSVDSTESGKPQQQRNKSILGLGKQDHRVNQRPHQSEEEEGTSTNLRRIDSVRSIVSRPVQVVSVSSDRADAKHHDDDEPPSKRRSTGAGAKGWAEPPTAHRHQAKADLDSTEEPQLQETGGLSSAGWSSTAMTADSLEGEEKRSDKTWKPVNSTVGSAVASLPPMNQQWGKNTKKAITISNPYEFRKELSEDIEGSENENTSAQNIPVRRVHSADTDIRHSHQEQSQDDEDNYDSTFDSHERPVDPDSLGGTGQVEVDTDIIGGAYEPGENDQLTEEKQPEPPTTAADDSISAIDLSVNESGPPPPDARGSMHISETGEDDASQESSQEDQEYRPTLLRTSSNISSRWDEISKGAPQHSTSQRFGVINQENEEEEDDDPFGISQSADQYEDFLEASLGIDTSRSIKIGLSTDDTPIEEEKKPLQFTQFADDQQADLVRQSSTLSASELQQKKPTESQTSLSLVPPDEEESETSFRGLHTGILNFMHPRSSETELDSSSKDGFSPKEMGSQYKIVDQDSSAQDTEGGDTISPFTPFHRHSQQGGMGGDFDGSAGDEDVVLMGTAKFGTINSNGSGEYSSGAEVESPGGITQLLLGATGQSAGTADSGNSEDISPRADIRTALSRVNLDATAMSATGSSFDPDSLMGDTVSTVGGFDDVSVSSNRNSAEFVSAREDTKTGTSPVVTGMPLLPTVPEEDLQESHEDQVSLSKSKPEMRFNTDGKEVRTDNKTEESTQGETIIPPSEEEEEGTGLTWKEGRAPMDGTVMGSIFEVAVNAVKLSKNIDTNSTEAHVVLEFVGIRSRPSHPIPIGHGSVVLSHFTHMVFGEDNMGILKEEIQEYGEDISLSLIIMVKVGDNLRQIGQGLVDLWVMIEDSVNIIRKDVSLRSMDQADEIGFAVVDVKGFSLLKKCAAVKRLMNRGIGSSKMS